MEVCDDSVIVKKEQNENSTVGEEDMEPIEKDEDIEPSMEVDVKPAVVKKPKVKKRKYKKRKSKVPIGIRKSDGKPKLKCGRKRKFPSQNDEEKKRRANSNEPYYNCNGVLVQPKEFQIVTECCRKQCFNFITPDYQRQEFNKFYTLGSYEARCLYIKSCVYLRQTRKTIELKKKTDSVMKVFVLNKIPVCHKFFLKLFQISFCRVKRVIDKVNDCNVSDKRGTKCDKRNKEEESKLEADYKKIKEASGENNVKPLIKTKWTKFT